MKLQSRTGQHETRIQRDMHEIYSLYTFKMNLIFKRGDNLRRLTLTQKAVKIPENYKAGKGYGHLKKERSLYLKNRVREREAPAWKIPELPFPGQT